MGLIHQRPVAAFLAASFALFVVATLVLAEAAHADELPKGVRNTQSPTDVSLTPDESLARMCVPDGFHVTLFAAEPDIRRPIAFDFDDRGRLWVVENYSHPEWKAGEGNDRIVILEDTDHDGQFDKRKVFWDKGRYLTAIAVGHGGVWIGNTPELSFIPDRDGDDIPDSAPVAKLDGFQISQNNVINNFHWGPDGWLYGAIGLATKSLVGPPGTPKDQRTEITRGMWRYHPYDDRFEVLALGMVNPWGADFNEFGDLFTSNTVIAHLWHIVPGMYCQRRGFEQDNRYAYGRIQSITDHLHWGGGKWTSSRQTDEHQTEEHHDDAGGGHAHCGAMIYLGDNWPDKYRGQFFTGNLHGNRLNNDKLVPSGSTYVGVHQPDFLFANDPWFRSMSQKYGPDGGVFVSDWHDLGECHDKDGSHRSSGRIYKVVYGEAERRVVDLQNATDKELAELHAHKNEWFVRHARRILHERHMKSQDVSGVTSALNRLLQGTNVVHRLRAMWSLALVGALNEERLVALSEDSDAHVRRWAARLLIDRGVWSDEVVAVLLRLARDSDPRVRLVVACSLQKVPKKNRWAVAESLVARSEDASDAYLPLMIWYGIEPIIPTDVEKSIGLAKSSKIPRVTQFIVRRLMEKRTPPIEPVVRFIASAVSQNQKAALIGYAEAIENRRPKKQPTEWRSLATIFTKSPDSELRSLAMRISIAYGDEEALHPIRKRLLETGGSLEQRRVAFQTLNRLGSGLPLKTLQSLLKDGSLRMEAITALAPVCDVPTAKLMLREFGSYSQEEKLGTVDALVATGATAELLLREIASGRIDKSLVSAYSLQKLRLHNSTVVRKASDSLWPADSNSSKKADVIAKYKKLLTNDYLADGNASQGRRLFEATCAKCHQLFGEGSDLAPELTGSGRADLDYVLSNLADPSGLIDPAYRMTTVLTDEGRVFNGFLVEHTEQDVTMRTQQGEVRLSMTDIEEMETSDQSMMPDGLLDSYSDEEVRDLVLYLRSSEQVPLPR